MRHVNFQAGLGLPSAEFRDWWSFQPARDYGVDVWSDEYEFEKPNMFTIEQVQELYYYMKSITLTPPEVTMTHQFYWQYISSPQRWITQSDPKYNPQAKPFLGYTNTTYDEWYGYDSSVPGTIRYAKQPPPDVGGEPAENGEQPDGTWVINGGWFDKVYYGGGYIFIGKFSDRRLVITKNYGGSFNSEIWESIPYTVEYNRTFRQRMKPVCIDNTWWNYFDPGDGIPGNALMEEIGNPGSGCFWENPNHKRFHNFEEIIFENPFQNSGGVENIDYKCKHLRETTIMGNIHFYCLGVNPADNKVYWTISSQEKQYQVDTEIEEYGNLDFVSNRYLMGYYDSGYDDPQSFFARVSLKTFWTSGGEFDENYWAYGAIILWIPDASCDVDRLATETNGMVKRIDVEIAPGISITFLQEKQFEDCFYPWSSGQESNTPNFPVAGLTQGENYMLDYMMGLESYFGYNYSRQMSSQSYIKVDNDWEITNPVMGVRT